MLIRGVSYSHLLATIGTPFVGYCVPRSGGGPDWLISRPLGLRARRDTFHLRNILLHAFSPTFFLASQD